ncbi:GNAT family N-acetyltransferase [Streptomyces sp. LBUM 1478]|nr:GNAT family N-acetyltransferase [Streptomyces sp. LBUM 1478]
MIDQGLVDGVGRRIALHEVDDENWRAVADIAPLDGQRRYVPALAARYLLLSLREGVWHSLAVRADDTVVGHVMWGRDEDGSYWVGGMLIDGAEQGRGSGGRWRGPCCAGWRTVRTVRSCALSYRPENTAAERLYTSLGFVPVPSGEGDADDEVVAELSATSVGRVSGAP